MRLVMKFGGTSVGDGKRIRGAAEIVKKYKLAGEGENEIVVIVSAMAGVTDFLIECARFSASGIASKESIAERVEELRRKHMDAIEDAIRRDELRREARNIVLDLCSDLERVLTGIHYLGELTPKSLDYIMSFGERLSAPLFSLALMDLGVQSLYLTGWEAGIVTDSSFGNASPIFPETERNVRSKILPLLERGVVPVVTGFIAADRSGSITTLGRGGSDLTASIIGACIDADEIWIWTDVDGVMTADPKIVKNARRIPILSYSEAAELAFFGARVLYPRCIEPAMRRNIPVRVKNTFNPDNPGTLIVSHLEKIEGIVKAVSFSDKVSLINVSGSAMSGIPGILSRVFGVLDRVGAQILMVSQSSGMTNLSIVVPKQEADKVFENLRRELEGVEGVEVTRDDDVAIVACVGAGMRGTPGVAARIFSAVAKRGVNILAIAQGSSEVNITFLVSRRDGPEAVRAIHDEFGLDKLFS